MIEYMKYIIVLLLSFLGVFLGGVLALIAPEELKAGEKYWRFSKYVLVLVMIIAIFYYSIKYSNILTAILISAALILLKLSNREYPALAFILFFSSIVDIYFFFAIASLIFIYGFLIGTLQSIPFLAGKLNKYLKISLKKIEMKKMFLAILESNVLYLIFGLIILPLLAYVK